MPRHKAMPNADPVVALSEEEMIAHPFIQIMARWVLEAEQERLKQEQLAQAQVKHPRRASQSQH